MPEQLPFANIKPYIEDPHKAYKTFSPQIISGPGEQRDVIVYHVKTDFQGLDKAHKESFVPNTEVEPAYVDLVPDINSLLARSQQRREQIINEGTVPEVMPFMAGARIVLAERRAKRQHAKAQSALRRAPFSRRVLVAHNIAESIVIEETDYTDPENQYRPKTLLETAMAKRMGRLIRRANHHNSSANIVEDMFTYPDGQVDFDRDRENLSIFENLRRSSAKSLYDMRREQLERLIHGRRIPIIGKRIGLFSFDSLAAGGPGSPIKKATKAFEKRDKAVLKAVALSRQQPANNNQRTALREAGHALKSELQTTHKMGKAKVTHKILSRKSRKKS